MLIVVLFRSSYMYNSAVLFWKYDFVEWNNYFLYLQSTLCVGLALKDVICDFHVDLSWVDLHGELLSPISFFTDLFHVSLSLPLFLFPLAPPHCYHLDGTWVHSTYNCTSAIHFHFLVLICWDRGIVLFLIHNSLFEMVFVQKRIRCLSCLRWPSSLSKIQNLRRNQHIILKDLDF